MVNIDFFVFCFVFFRSVFVRDFVRACCFLFYDLWFVFL